MQITITPEAKKLLDKYEKEKNIFLLTMNDGVNKYSNMGSCASVLAFQIVVINHADPIYQIKLENSANLPIYTGKRELGMLGTGLKLKARNGALSLVSDEGVIDDTVIVRNLTKNKSAFILKQR